MLGRYPDANTAAGPLAVSRPTRDGRGEVPDSRFGLRNRKRPGGGVPPRVPSLQIHRHDHVQEIRPALKQAWSVRRAELQADLVAVHHAERVGQELRVEADLDVAALVLAREIDRGLAALGAAAGQHDALLAERHPHTLALL